MEPGLILSIYIVELIQIHNHTTILWPFYLLSDICRSLENNMFTYLGGMSKCLWALKSKSYQNINIVLKMNIPMYGQDILCGILKIPFEISHKISCPYIE